MANQTDDQSFGQGPAQHGWKGFGKKLHDKIIDGAYTDQIIDSVKQVEEMAGEASEDACDRIIKGIARECQVTESEALVGSACILQRGGTSRNASATIKMDFRGNSVTLDSIRRQCRATNDTKVRQFARGLKNEIIEVMKFLGQNAPDGNLAKTMRLDKDLTKELAIWCSDFQTYNSLCPDEVRAWLVRNYRNRFRRN